ncbi:protein transport inhibitor response 1 [Tanacetum coccineum]
MIRISLYPENLTSLEVLNFATLSSEVSFDILESLVSQSKSLRVLKVKQKVTFNRLQKFLVLAPRLTELRIGTLSENLVSSSVKKLESAFSKCGNLHTLSGFWDASLVYIPGVYPVLDTVRGKGLEAVGSHYPLLEELLVLPADPFDPQTGVSKSGLVVVSNGCPKLHYILYFCHRMTNAAKPHEPDYLTNEPMDKAFGAIYAKNLETLSVAFTSSSDSSMEYVMRGCPKLKRLEIRDCPFGDSALLSGSKENTTTGHTFAFDASVQVEQVAAMESDNKETMENDEILQVKIVLGIDVHCVKPVESRNTSQSEQELESNSGCQECIKRLESRCELSETNGNNSQTRGLHDPKESMVEERVKMKKTRGRVFSQAEENDAEALTFSQSQNA